MRIFNLQAENYKRLKAVSITPEGNIVTIGGRNAQGKTSVLDAIWAALAGGEASRATQQPIRDGQDTAVVKLDLGDYVVTRRWTKDDAGTLTVESADGAKYSSPQKLLDEVIGARAFDPLAFTRQSAKEQVATLVSTVDLPFDPAELERERKGVFDTRADANREVKRLEGQLSGYAQLSDIPDEEVSAFALSEKLGAAQSAVQRHDDTEDELVATRSTIERLHQELQIARNRERDLQTWLDTNPRAALPDIEAIREELANVDSLNAKVREQKQRATVAADLSTAKERAAQLTLKLQQIEKRKADALAAVKFPVENLSFNEDGVTFNGIPFSQASAAEQLRVSVGLAMAANPTLRVLRILDGSLLDSDSMKIIADMATANDYQVWVEVVDESGKVGIVIEDGEVRA